MNSVLSSKILLYFGLMLLGASGFFFTVIWPQPQGFYAFIIIASLGGFGVAANIWYTKRIGGHLVCPTGSNCNAVVTSKYSKFFGISLEYLGMLYFIIIISSYAVLTVSPSLLTGSFLMAVVLLSIGAAFFSSYLLFVQGVLLKQWCIWCILASAISLVIFFISMISLPVVSKFFSDAEIFLEMLGLLGFVIGMGTSTAAVFLFSSFLKDADIDEKEAESLKTISELVWLGLAFVLISRFALYVAHAETLTQSGAFLAQIVALFGAGIAGAVLLIIFAPFLEYVPFKESPGQPSNLGYLRRPTFITGAIALSSWYFAFAANFTSYLNYSFEILLAAYIVFVVGSVLLSLLWEKSFAKNKEAANL